MLSATAEQRNRAMCRAYLDWLAKRGRKPITVYQYAQKLEVFCDWVGDRPFSALQLPELEAFIDRPRVQRAHGKQGADATKQKDVVVLRNLWSFCVSHGLLHVDVASSLQAVTVRNANPRAIDPEPWRAVWLSDQLTQEERVLLGLGFFCGLRREEIVRLQPHHFDTVEGRIVNFPRKGDTNSKATGVVPYLSCARLFGERRPDLIGMPEDFLLPLTTLLAQRQGHDYLLPWGARVGKRNPDRPQVAEGMTSPDRINRRLLLTLRRLGLPERLFTPHALRHSFCTYVLQMGVPIEVVSRLAGHSNISITMRYVKIASDPLAQYLTEGNASLRQYEPVG